MDAFKTEWNIECESAVVEIDGDRFECEVNVNPEGGCDWIVSLSSSGGDINISGVANDRDVAKQKCMSAIRLLSGLVEK